MAEVIIVDNADQAAWPGRRAGVWLGAVGIAMMIIGVLASAGLMEISQSGQQMTPSALESLYPLLAQVTGLATMSGTALLGGGIVL